MGLNPVSSTQLLEETTQRLRAAHTPILAGCDTNRDLCRRLQDRQPTGRCHTSVNTGAQALTPRMGETAFWQSLGLKGGGHIPRNRSLGDSVDMGRSCPRLRPRRGSQGTSSMRRSNRFMSSMWWRASSIRINETGSETSTPVTRVFCPRSSASAAGKFEGMHSGGHSSS